MGRRCRRIGSTRRFNEPVHVAYRGPQYSSGWRKGLSWVNRSPSTKQSYSNGRPTPKKAADFVQQHKAGYFYITLPLSTRCRGPPILFDPKI